MKLQHAREGAADGRGNGAKASGETESVGIGAALTCGEDVMEDVPVSGEDEFVIPGSCWYFKSRRRAAGGEETHLCHGSGGRG